MILNSDTIMAIAAAISVVISIIAIILSIRAKNFVENRSCIETSIALTNEYEKLLIDMKVMKEFIIEHKEIYATIQDKVKRNEIEKFNKSELESIFNRQFDNIDRFFTGETMDVSLMRKYYAIERRAKHLSTENVESISINDLKFYYSHKIGQILNKLEAISMAFVNNVASSKVVYESLHQSFFQIVTLLYFPLAKNNIEKKDPFFTCIIDLFKEWRDFDNYLSDRFDKNYPKNLFRLQGWKRYSKKAKARRIDKTRLALCRPLSVRQMLKS